MENNEIIDGSYWLKWDKDHTNEAIKKLENGAEKLEKLSGTFLTFYTALYGVGGMFAFNFTKYENVSLLAVILLAIPIVTLMLSFWSCYKAQMPVIVEAAEIEEDEKFKNAIAQTQQLFATEEIVDILKIKYAYNKIIEKKTKRIELALTFALSSAISMALGLVALFIQHNLAQI